MQYYNIINLYYLIEPELKRLGIKDETKLKVMEHLFEIDLNSCAGGWAFLEDEIEFDIAKVNNRYQIKFKTFYTKGTNTIEVFKDLDQNRESYIIDMQVDDNTMSIISDNESIVYNMNYTNEGSRNEYVFVEDDKVNRIRFHKFELDDSLSYDHTEYLDKNQTVDDVPSIILNFYKEERNKKRLHR